MMKMKRLKMMTMYFKGGPIPLSSQKCHRRVRVGTVFVSGGGPALSCFSPDSISSKLHALEAAKALQISAFAGPGTAGNLRQCCHAPGPPAVVLA
jgi:hypothetical protein